MSPSPRPFQNAKCLGGDGCLWGEIGGIVADRAGMIDVENDAVIAREPLVESPGGVFGSRVARGEGAAEHSANRLARPAVSGTADFDVATAFDVESQFGDDPASLLVVEQEETPAVLPNERRR